jgi:hypothetical protein
MTFNSFPFREYVSVAKRSVDDPFCFAQIYFPLSNLLNRTSVKFNAIVRNLDDNAVSFKLQSGVNDTSVSTINVFSDIGGETYTVVGGGEVYIDLDLYGDNTLQFVVTSITESNPKVRGSRLMIVGAATSDPQFLLTPEKDYYREELGLSHWDTSTSSVIDSVGEYTDQSGTITSGGASQEVCPSNASRRFFFFQNVSDTDMWLNFSTSATASQPSIKVATGLAFEPDVVDTGSVHVICATTGKEFTCKEL